ncbi:hypothetical protein YDYSY3_57830 [Paenibacillus chitinolyticus]|uniref:DUF7210 family protein n=1 Tax=Paenibacillus chitinolyticus TaxID=79263 RepID=UPI0026E5016E|nr:hypothetical protein [Paenibacillus chitinolyticus]GKS14783.1 hypothetical protein YDYSY3_57830 [Paenibacillus chitinolyticus]
MAYIAKEKVQHNSVLYNIGDVIKDLSEEEAERLLDLDVVKENERSVPAKDDKTGGTAAGKGGKPDGGK